MENKQVSKSEFKAKALEFFRQIEASGESLIVTDHRKPTLAVRPYRGSKRNPLDVLSGSAMRYDNPTDPIAMDDWEAGGDRFGYTHSGVVGVWRSFVERNSE